MQAIDISSTKRSELIDITGKVNAVVAKEKVKDGVIFLFVPHTTAALTINENADPDVRTDIINGLSTTVPRGAGYLHAEGNADSHIKSSLMGQELFLMIEDGAVFLGRWQALYFCEFDGPRNRKVNYRFG